MSYQPKRLALAEVGTAHDQTDRIRDMGANINLACGECLTETEMRLLYRCYYCHIWFCEECMGKHLEERQLSTQPRP